MTESKTNHTIQDQQQERPRNRIMEELAEIQEECDGKRLVYITGSHDPYEHALETLDTFFAEYCYKVKILFHSN
ncbi:MAG: hypothetical protein GF311_10730 [Candidatus Lokiarchaeota archaeon]|nr:hypothetical protein [Candidatus Lokiarchaeota archaeon]